MSCPHCQAPLADDARFCPGCGKAVVATETQADTSGGLPAARDLIGREVAGRYRVLAKLGEGGMGAVYRAEQISLRRAIALKVLRPEMSQNPMVLRRFEAEATSVAKLAHPNTVSVYDSGQDADGSLFIAMELIEGSSLRAVIQREAPLSPQRALAIAIQVAASLADAHAHAVVHRDLKPDNVMLQERGRLRDVARVLDFGIAKLRDDSRATQAAMTQAGDMLGTPQYMAPEQIRGEPVDGRCDVYALGCMIYEMITGRMPFEASTVMAMLTKHLTEHVMAPSARRPELGIPQPLDRLVVMAMQKDPKARPTMEAYGEQLVGLAASLPADPRRAPATSASAMRGVAVASATPMPAPAPTPARPMQVVPTAMPIAAQVAPTAHVAPLPLPPIPPTKAVDPKRRGRSALWIALIAVLVAGGALAIGVAMRSSSSPDSEHTPLPRRDEPPPPTQDTPPPGPSDPWKTSGGTNASVGISMTPIPAGTRLKLPSSFVRKAEPSGKAIAYVDAKKQITIVLGPLDAGTNDVDALTKQWVAEQHVTFAGRSQVVSAGSDRDAVDFTYSTAAGPFHQLIVVYLDPRYRLALLVQGPQRLFDDASFRQDILQFLGTGVLLPR